MPWKSDGVKRCPRECPNRAPGCHNVETCENWAQQVEAQRKKLEARRAAYVPKRKSWEDMGVAKARVKKWHGNG